MIINQLCSGADLGGGCRGCAPSSEMTCSFLILNWYYAKKKTMWFIGVEVEQETSAPPPKKNPGSTPDVLVVSKSTKVRIPTCQRKTSWLCTHETTMNKSSAGDRVGIKLEAFIL